MKIDLQIRQLTSGPARMLYSLGLLLVLAGCNVLDGDGESDDLRDHQRRWQALNIDDYSFEMRRSCFCGGPHGFVRITVRNDSIISLIEVETNQPPQQFFEGQFGTIDEIFDDLIRRADDAHKIDLAFDATYHFPSEVSVDPIRNAVDDEFGLSLRNFQR